MEEKNVVCVGAEDIKIALRAMAQGE